jgi:hypothetical protein
MSVAITRPGRKEYLLAVVGKSRLVKNFPVYIQSQNVPKFLLPHKNISTKHFEKLYV